MLYHGQAFAERDGAREEIRRVYRRLTSDDPALIEVPADVVPLRDAVASYLFNSQLVTTPEGMALVCPVECREVASSRAFLEELLHRNTPIKAVHFIDVRQSMNNGGGPACLRLRIVLSKQEQAAMHQGVVLTPALYDRLVKWVNQHYREEIRPEDLADVKLLEESRAALDELTRILELGSSYPFQGT